MSSKSGEQQQQQQRKEEEEDDENDVFNSRKTILSRFRELCSVCEYSDSRSSRESASITS
jgi:hypothetical protein